MNRYSLLFQKLLWNVREDGVAETVRRGAGMIRQELFQGSEHVMCFDVDAMPEEAVPTGGEISIAHYARREDIPAGQLEQLRSIVRKRHMPEEMVQHYLDYLLRMFDDGGEICLALCNGEVAGFIWIFRASGNYREYFQFFTITPRDGVLCAAFTRPEYRGRGILPTLNRFGFQVAKARGMQYVYASCKTWNAASYRGLVKAGMQRVGTARYLKVLGRYVVVWSANEKECL